uniref:Uncharacterized protein n=1 Tax=Heterosigma akashiwo TaxID=2829 RepID=A0A7S3XRX8_HETAK
MPNHRMTSGISASAGMLRSICSVVSSRASAAFQVPVSRPSTRPRPPPSASAEKARTVLTATWWANSPERSSRQNAAATAAGSGRMRADSRPLREASSQATRMAAGSSQGVRRRRIASAGRHGLGRVIVGHHLAERAGQCRGTELLAHIQRQQREHQLGEAVGFIKVRVATQDEVLQPERGVCLDAVRHLLRVAHQRRAGAAAHQAHAGPEVGRNLQAVAHIGLVEAAAVQLGHAALADRVHALEAGLRRADGGFVQLGQQLARGAPGLVLGLAHDDMQPDAVAQRAPVCGGALAHVGQLLGHLLGRLAPGQIGVHLRRRQLVGRRRGAAEEHRRIGAVDRRIQDLAGLDAQMLAFEVEGLAVVRAGQQLAPDPDELGGLLVACRVVEELAVAGQLFGIAAGDQVDQQPTARQPVQRGGHAGALRRRHQAGAQRDEEFQLACRVDQAGRNHPGVFAAAAGGQQHALVAQAVGGDRDLLEVGMVGHARAARAAEVAAVAVGGNEPEDLHGGLGLAEGGGHGIQHADGPGDEAELGEGVGHLLLLLDEGAGQRAHRRRAAALHHPVDRGQRQGGEVGIALHRVAAVGLGAGVGVGQGLEQGLHQRGLAAQGRGGEVEGVVARQPAAGGQRAQLATDLGGGEVGVPDGPGVHRAAFDGRTRFGWGEVDGLDVGPCQAGAAQGLHGQEVGAAALLQRDAFAFQGRQGFQRRIGLDQHRRAVGLGRLGAHIDHVLAGGLGEHRRRIAGGTEVHAAQSQGLEQLRAGGEFGPAHLGAGQALLQQAIALQQREVKRALLETDAQALGRRVHGTGQCRSAGRHQPVAPLHAATPRHAGRARPR